jgi:hypothetical protein
VQQAGQRHGVFFRQRRAFDRRRQMPERRGGDLVTQAMKSVLGPRSSQLSLPSSPQLITTPTLWHLQQPVARFAVQHIVRLAAGGAGQRQ